MGSIISGVVGGLGSLFGGSQGSKLDLTGFNYLKNNPLMNAFQSAGTGALSNMQGLQGTEAALLGVGGDPAAGQAAFQNYLNSTGYKFQLGQGQQAIAGSSAARGMLNSGSTAKALTGYGQGLAGNYFQNYLGQLGGLNSQYQGVANMGLNAAETTGEAGTKGGVAAGDTMQSGMSSGFGQLGSALGDLGNGQGWW